MRSSFARLNRRRRLHALAATLLYGATSLGHAQLPSQPSAPIALPALGDASAQDLSPMAERRLGDRIMRAIRSDPDVIDDPLILEYIEQVWQSLLRAARQRGEITPELAQSHAWEPFLVRDRTVNAFALPGGYIGVHLGLLAITRTPDELASVLAHEMSHVTQRHIARMLSQQSRTSWVALTSLLLGVLAASRNPAAAQAMIMGGQAAAIQGQLNFSRDMEREADRVGFSVLSDAGFRPSGMALMFEQLQQASRLNDDGRYPYLRTHPLTLDRIAEARARLGPGGWDATRAAQPDDSAQWAQHALMSARSRVLMDTRNVALENLIGLHPRDDASPLDALVVHYTRAVAWQRSNQSRNAMQALGEAKALVRQLPAQQQSAVSRVLALTLTDMQLQAQQVETARQTLLRDTEAGRASVVKLEARPELLMAARVALALPGGADRKTAWQDAANRLQTHLSVHPQDASAWSMLSSLWERLEQPIRAVRADAEAAAAIGDLPGAIDRAQGARQRFRQPDAAATIELSVLDSRMKTWQRQLREDMREDGGR